MPSGAPSLPVSCVDVAAVDVQKSVTLDRADPLRVPSKDSSSRCGLGCPNLDGERHRRRRPLEARVRPREPGQHPPTREPGEGFDSALGEGHQWLPTRGRLRIGRASLALLVEWTTCSETPQPCRSTPPRFSGKAFRRGSGWDDPFLAKRAITGSQPGGGRAIGRPRRAKARERSWIAASAVGARAWRGSASAWPPCSARRRWLRADERL
jgi:hypothetical protein